MLLQRAGFECQVYSLAKEPHQRLWEGVILDYKSPTELFYKIFLYHTHPVVQMARLH